ncbi:MAG: HTH domain-containing protein, partial [Streptomycetaceae bacterium]|nr:HTH domain-containing protein [Streptomycetaceae bacterium]
MADVTRRMLDLLTALQTGRTFPGTDLARRLGVSPRTLRRDIERLREYGYPVQTRPGPHGFYRLRSGTSVPPLIFDDDEAVATLVGLALAGTTARGGEGPGGDGSDADADRAANSIAAAADRAFGNLDHLLPTRL